MSKSVSVWIPGYKDFAYHECSAIKFVRRNRKLFLVLKDYCIFNLSDYPSGSIFHVCLNRFIRFTIIVRPDNDYSFRFG